MTNQFNDITEIPEAAGAFDHFVHLFAQPGQLSVFMPEKFVPATQ
jgi:hypothetical protein